MRSLPRLAASVLALALATGSEAATVKVDYAITLGGLSLGTAVLDGTVDDQRYDMKVSGQLTGLAGVFSGSSRGSAAARGAIAGSRVVSGGFSAAARSGSNERTVQVGVSGGNVTAVEINPPFPPQDDRVPLSEASLRGITDPLSGVVMVSTRAKPDDPANCARTIPVFDGTQRFDIVLSYAETRLVRKAGFTGNVLVCAVRYVPVAGHRIGRPSVQFMEENRDMSVWLAPVQGTRVLVPLRIEVRTMIGTSIVDATRWAIEAGQARPLTR